MQAKELSKKAVTLIELDEAISRICCGDALAELNRAITDGDIPLFKERYEGSTEVYAYLITIKDFRGVCC